MKFLVLSVIILCCFKGYSQTGLDSLISANEDSVGFKLAELAIQNNPSIKAVDKQIDASRYNVKAIRGSWLNYIQGTFNVNERSLNGGTNPGEQNAFYPRYNLNIGIPLGLFFTKGSQVKQARSQWEEAGVRKEIESNELRKLVRQAYQNYKMAGSMVSLQEMVVQDEQVLYNQVEEKFKNNQVQLEIFTNASKRYNAELVKQLSLKNAVTMAKIELEALLAIDLETAMALINK